MTPGPVNSRGDTAPGRAVISRDMFEKLMFRLKESFEASMQAGGETACYLDEPKEVISGAHRGVSYKLSGTSCPAATIRLFPTARRFYVVATVGTAENEMFLNSFVILNSDERLVIQ